jgi:hypothetical protein
MRLRLGLQVPPVRRHLAAVEPAVDLEPSERLGEVVAAHQQPTRADRGVRVPEALLSEKYQAQAVHVAPREGQRQRLDSAGGRRFFDLAEGFQLGVDVVFGDIGLQRIDLFVGPRPPLRLASRVAAQRDTERDEQRAHDDRVRQRLDRRRLRVAVVVEPAQARQQGLAVAIEGALDRKSVV